MCKNVQCTGKKMAVFLNDFPALQGFDIHRDSATESARLQKWLRIFEINCILDRQGYERKRYCFIVEGGGVELQDVYQKFTFDPRQPGDGETKYSVVKKQFYDYFEAQVNVSYVRQQFRNMIQKADKLKLVYQFITRLRQRVEF